MRITNYLKLPKTGKAGKAKEKKLAQLADVLNAKRVEAVEYRRNLGIESEWIEDLAFYEGMERPDQASPTSSNKPLLEPDTTSQGDQQGDQPQSEIFINVTEVYTDTAAGRLQDLVVPGDDRAWTIEPTPVPDVEAIAKGGDIPTHLDEIIENEINARDGLDESQRVQAKDSARTEMQAAVKRMFDVARQRANRAQTQIDDWHKECKFHTEQRRQIDDAAQAGTGILKGPVPMNAKRLSWKGGKATTETYLRPGSFRCDYWNCYPDAACGENIQDGEHHWEKEPTTRHGLRVLSEEPGVMREVVAEILQEGPMHDSVSTEDEARNKKRMLSEESRRRLFDVWHGYAFLDAEDLQTAGVEMFETNDDVEDRKNLLHELEDVACYVMMCNEKIIKIAPNPIHSGSFPYDYFPLAARAGLPWGRGIPRKCRDPQRVILGASRMMMSNAGVAAGPMIVFDPFKITPTNKVWEIKAWKTWQAVSDDIDDLTKAFTTINIDMSQTELERIVMMAQKWMEDVTGQPVLLQGQAQENTPDTVGGMKLLNDNATSPMRRTARLMDDRQTEPHISRYYEYLLLHGDGRGTDFSEYDLEVHASGSAALIQRDAETLTLLQMMPFSGDPMYGIDPEKMVKMILRGMHLNPKDVMFDDEMRRQIMEQLKQQAEAPDSAVSVAEIKAEVDGMKIQSGERKAEADRKAELLVEQMRRRSGDMETQVNAMISRAKNDADLMKSETALKGLLEKVAAEYRKHSEDQQNELLMFILGEEGKQKIEGFKAKAKQHADQAKSASAERMQKSKDAANTAGQAT